MGCIFSCFHDFGKKYKVWRRRPYEEPFTHMKYNGNSDLHLQNSYQRENFFEGINFTNVDESESQDDIIYQEVIRSLMKRNDSNRKRENEEEENSFSG